jgi:hypothetical protein
MTIFFILGSRILANFGNLLFIIIIILPFLLTESGTFTDISQMSILPIFNLRRFVRYLLSVIDILVKPIRKWVSQESNNPLKLLVIKPFATLGKKLQIFIVIQSEKDLLTLIQIN